MVPTIIPCATCATSYVCSFIYLITCINMIPYSWFILSGLNSCARAETQKLDPHKLIT